MSSFGFESVIVGYILFCWFKKLLYEDLGAPSLRRVPQHHFCFLHFPPNHRNIPHGVPVFPEIASLLYCVKVI